MCIAVPGEILSVEGDGTAVADFGGVRRTISLSLLDEAVVGDFVIVHAGFALHRIDPEQARETLDLLRSVLGDEPQ